MHKRFTDTFIANQQETYSDEDIKQQNVRIARSVARYNGWLVVVGIVAAVISYFQWKEIHDGSTDTHTLAESAKNQSAYAKATANTAREAYIAENRAFIGPSDASLANLEIGQGIKATVSYRNTGREPVGVGYSILVRDYDDRTQWNVFAISISQIISEKEACMHADLPQSGFAFPNTGFSQYSISIDTDSTTATNRRKVVEAMKNGSSVIVVNGCMTYHSIGVVRHTAFCFFYKANTTLDIMHLNLCQNGWAAD